MIAILGAITKDSAGSKRLMAAKKLVGDLMACEVERRKICTIEDVGDK